MMGYMFLRTAALNIAQVNSFVVCVNQNTLTSSPSKPAAKENRSTRERILE